MCSAWRLYVLPPHTSAGCTEYNPDRVVLKVENSGNPLVDGTYAADDGAGNDDDDDGAVVYVRHSTGDDVEAPVASIRCMNYQVRPAQPLPVLAPHHWS